MADAFERLVRFTPRSDPKAILIGEPVDKTVDVGLATRNGEDVQVKVFSGSTVLNAGTPTEKIELIGRLLSPLATSEVGSIRCIGLNYVKHAEETGMALPPVPVLFIKPATSLADPYPKPTVVPRFSQKDNCCDYESELAVVIGRTCKNVSEEKALEYVLGYTACNDVSHRDTQLETSQWCFSKGFDGACPTGPCLVSLSLIPDPSKLRVRGIKNKDKVLQDGTTDDLFFSVPRIISHLSRSTTLLPGTLILTGTPAGVAGWNDPPEWLQEGDEFSVEITPHIGTMTTKFENAKPPKGPFRLVTVNIAPERAKRLVGRVADNLADRYIIEHVDNCASMDLVKDTFERVKPDMMFSASMWSPEEAEKIRKIASEACPGIKTHAIPHGMQVEKGPDYVVTYLTDEVPKMLDE